jgi:hypothetical protein
MAVTLGKQRDDAVQAREALQQSGRAQAGESWPAPEDLHRKLKEIKREARLRGSLALCLLRADVVENRWRYPIFPPLHWHKRI